MCNMYSFLCVICSLTTFKIFSFTMCNMYSFLCVICTLTTFKIFSFVSAVWLQHAYVWFALYSTYLLGAYWNFWISKFVFHRFGENFSHYFFKNFFMAPSLSFSSYWYSKCTHDKPFYIFPQVIETLHFFLIFWFSEWLIFIDLSSI